MRPLPHLDLKEHLRLLHKQVLPIFFLILSIVLVAFVVYRTGEAGAELPDEGHVATRLGLLQPTADATFDADFATLSPIELVLAPYAPVFSPPRPPLPARGVEVHAVADGRVALANASEVILSHERQGQIVGSVYTGLSSVRVGVGTQVRRGETLGIADEAFRFETRVFPALASRSPANAVAGVPDEWRGRPAGRLSAPPQGEPLEPGALRLEESPER